MLQLQLVMAPPGQKADIVDEIERVNALITQAEAGLSELQALLDRCVNRFPRGQEVNVGATVLVSSG